MTKMELVDRIRDITGKRDLATKKQLMDCVDGFAETLLSRVKLETVQALHFAVTATLTNVRAEGRGK